MKYKIKNTDLFLNGKLIPEGTEVELSKQDSESLSAYLEEVPSAKENKTENKSKSQSKVGDQK